MLTEHDRLLLAISRLQCQAFYFFKLHNPIDEDKLVSLHLTACRILRAARNLNTSEEFMSVAPIYYRFGILLAAYVLLRLLKSPFGRYLDAEVNDCFLSSIDMAGRLSRAAGDHIDKHATVLRQLYHSTRAFKKSDGSDYTILRIRTRLSVSVGESSHSFCAGRMYEVPANVNSQRLTQFGGGRKSSSGSQVSSRPVIMLSIRQTTYLHPPKRCKQTPQRRSLSKQSTTT